MPYISYFPKLQGYQIILSKALAREESKIESVYTSMHTKFLFVLQTDSLGIRDEGKAFILDLF